MVFDFQCISHSVFYSLFLQMRIPTEHFENIPVYTLSPSPTSLEKGKQVYTYQKYVPPLPRPTLPVY